MFTVVSYFIQCLYAQRNGSPYQQLNATALRTYPKPALPSLTVSTQQLNLLYHNTMSQQQGSRLCHDYYSFVEFGCVVHALPSCVCVCVCVCIPAVTALRLQCDEI